MLNFKRTPTDKDVTETIMRIRRNGVKVALKPMINCEDGIWRALINFPDQNMMGRTMMPWDFTHKEFHFDEEEQARFYDSCLTVFSGKSWFAGVFWWDWSTKIYGSRETASNDTEFNIHLKKAKNVLKNWYKTL